MNRLLLVISISVLALMACSQQRRQEPPAPVVSVSTPQAPAPAPAPKPEPVAPTVQPVQVYAYQHPGEAPPVPSDASGQPVVAAGEPGTGEPDPAGGDAGPGSAGQAAAETSGPGTQPPSPPTATAPPSPENNVAGTLTPAAQALAQQAEQQRQMGDYAGAAATLERGLRIAPQEAYLWNRLARVRLEQGLPSQAGNLASRSNSLSAGDLSALKQDNWRIIADARRQAGDVAGAQEAELKARGG